VTVEDLAHQVVHLRGRAARCVLVVQEPGRGVGDRLLVVADLEDGDPAHADGDLLRVDALDVEDRLVGLHRQVLGLLQHRDDQGAAAGDDLVRASLGAGRLALGAAAGDDQRLVGSGHLVQALEDHGDDDRDHDDRDDDSDQDRAHGCGLSSRGWG
jgi:hypothetical protein